MLRGKTNSPWLASVEALAVFKIGVLGSLSGFWVSEMRLKTREERQETSAPVSYNQLLVTPYRVTGSRGLLPENFELAELI